MEVKVRVTQPQTARVSAATIKVPLRVIPPPFEIFDSLRSRGGIGLANPGNPWRSSESSRENAWAGASLAVERAGHMAASSWATLLSSPQSPNSAWDLLLSERNASSTASSLAASDEVEPTLSDWDRFAGAELISSPSLSRKASKEQCDARKPGDGSCTPAASPARR